ncbi:MAG TPA: thioesterase family protein, partial [Actinomycetota bacterium]|nr:thioesterase family protein [Actinomycetota bacterium]
PAGRPFIPARGSRSVTAPESFFVRSTEEEFLPTGLTRGPWDPDAQHGGPPAALLGRGVEEAAGAADMQVVRLTFEILRPVPLTPLRLTSQVARPGRRVQMIDASLSDEEGPVMTARGWVMRMQEIEPVAPDEDRSPPPSHERGHEVELFDSQAEVSYLTGMEWRFVRGAFLEPGPATAWLRMRHPLVDGEPVSPLTRVLIAADSASGISAALDPKQWLFINPDLTVYLHRMPEGEWVCLEAATTIESHGIGAASSRVHDERGPIGTTGQSLLVAPR